MVVMPTIARVVTAVALVLLIAPPAVEAQDAGKAYRIAIVNPSRPVTDMTEGGQMGLQGGEDDDPDRGNHGRPGSQPSH